MKGEIEIDHSPSINRTKTHLAEIIKFIFALDVCRGREVNIKDMNHPKANNEKNCNCIFYSAFFLL